jgi:carbon storage regulator
MLIITRKKGQSIMIGEDIEITVSKLEDGSVKLGIDAPKEMTILRKELYEEVRKENEEAMKINIDLLKNIRKQ